MSDLKTLEKPETAKDAPKLAKPLPPKSGWRWQWLIAPLMGISVVLHIALLFVPLPSLDHPTEETIEEDTSEPDDEAPMDILSLSEIAAPEPPPAAPAEQPQAPPESPPPPPSNMVPPPPEPSPVQELPPEEPFVEEELPPEDGFENPPPAFDAAAATQQFIGNIAGLGVGDFTADFGMPPPENFAEPGHAVCFLQPNGEPVPAAREARLLDKSPQTLLRENLPQAYGPSGITFSPLDPFCGELYYQAISAEGEPFMTLSLVALQGSTLLVIWETPPQ